MTSQAPSERSLNQAESAFGRPASWKGAYPALAAGLLGFLAAVYGTYWLPASLPGKYVSALQEAQAQYQSLAKKSNNSSSSKLLDHAGELDVIYSRLVSLERNNPERYWEWAEFLGEHARQLRQRLQDPVFSLRPENRTQWLKQAERFEAKNFELLEQLAARPSSVQKSAMLRVCQLRYRQGIGEFGVADAAGLAERLHSALEPETPTELGVLTAEEMAQAQLLLIQLQIEAAWQTPRLENQPVTNLLLHADKLVKAKLWYEKYSPSQTNGNELEWRATGQLLSAMTGSVLDIAQSREAQESGSQTIQQVQEISPEHAWRQDLAKLQLAAVEGDWSEVTRGLTSRMQAPPPQITSGLARTICRLLCSPLADPQTNLEATSVRTSGDSIEEETPAALSGTLWNHRADKGLAIASQLAPHLPECAELLWECAAQHTLVATTVDEPTEAQSRGVRSVSKALAQAIMSGEHAIPKHSIAALSATLAEQPQVARTHMELLRRGQASLSLIAQVALWRSRMLNFESAEEARQLDQLERLMDEATRIEPESGLNWFVLGAVQLQRGHYEQMRESLTKARKILGDVPAINQLLQAATMRR